jgi:hypothetical protein
MVAATRGWSPTSPGAREQIRGNPEDEFGAAAPVDACRPATARSQALGTLHRRLPETRETTELAIDLRIDLRNSSPRSTI